MELGTVCQISDGLDVSGETGYALCRVLLTQTEKTLRYKCSISGQETDISLVHMFVVEAKL
jgi:hypothetical protein